MSRRLGIAFALALTTLPSEASADDDHTRFGVGGGIGFAGFGRGLGKVTEVGGALELHAIVALRRFFAVEARHATLAADAHDAVAAEGTRVVSSSWAAVARAILPITPFRPYALAGVGVDRIAIVGAAPTPLRGATTASVPLGAGLEIPVVRGVVVGLEAVYRALPSARVAIDPTIATAEVWTSSVWVAWLR